MISQYESFDARGRIAARVRNTSRWLLSHLLSAVLLVCGVTFIAHTVLLHGGRARRAASVVAHVSSPSNSHSDPGLMRQLLASTMQREVMSAILRAGSADSLRAAKGLLSALMGREATQLRERATALQRRMSEERSRRGAWRAYLDWCGRLLRGEIDGRWTSGLAQRFGATLLLCAGAYAIACLVGSLLALGYAMRGGNVARWGYYAACVVSGLPAFVIGYVLLAVVGAIPRAEPAKLAFALATLTCSSGLVSEIGRLLHHLMSDELGQNYVKTARAKGLADAVLPLPGSVSMHAFRQAAAHFVPRLIARAPQVFGMSLVVEALFDLSGLGMLFLSGLRDSDGDRVLIVVLACAVAALLSLWGARAAKLTFGAASMHAR